MVNFCRPSDKGDLLSIGLEGDEANCCAEDWLELGIWMKIDLTLCGWLGVVGVV